MVANVPPLIPPFHLKAVVEVSIMASGPTIDLRVLLERKTERSEGMESSPQDGTIVEPV